MQVLFEIMVQIKQKRGIGVEIASPRSFSGGLYSVLDLLPYANSFFFDQDRGGVGCQLAVI